MQKSLVCEFGQNKLITFMWGYLNDKWILIKIMLGGLFLIFKFCDHTQAIQGKVIFSFISLWCSKLICLVTNKYYIYYYKTEYSRAHNYKIIV